MYIYIYKYLFREPERIIPLAWNILQFVVHRFFTNEIERSVWKSKKQTPAAVLSLHLEGLSIDTMRMEWTTDGFTPRPPMAEKKNTRFHK